MKAPTKSVGSENRKHDAAAWSIRIRSLGLTLFKTLLVVHAKAVENRKVNYRLVIGLILSVCANEARNTTNESHSNSVGTWYSSSKPTHYTV